mmetsp:Transcript_9886/g.31352  ORF Transcript_9886/g.31352 Transcript_9886/m.31352 type:complete len:393 (+) Transcript_9886:173-1351(+)
MRSRTPRRRRRNSSWRRCSAACASSGRLRSAGRCGSTWSWRSALHAASPRRRCAPTSWTPPATPPSASFATSGFEAWPTSTLTWRWSMLALSAATCLPTRCTRRCRCTTCATLRLRDRARGGKSSRRLPPPAVLARVYRRSARRWARLQSRSAASATSSPSSATAPPLCRPTRAQACRWAQRAAAARCWRRSRRSRCRRPSRSGPTRRGAAALSSSRSARGPTARARRSARTAPCETRWPRSGCPRSGRPPLPPPPGRRMCAPRRGCRSARCWRTVAAASSCATAAPIPSPRLAAAGCRWSRCTSPGTSRRTRRGSRRSDSGPRCRCPSPPPRRCSPPCAACSTTRKRRAALRRWQTRWRGATQAPKARRDWWSARCGWRRAGEDWKRVCNL